MTSFKQFLEAMQPKNISSMATVTDLGGDVKKAYDLLTKNAPLGLEALKSGRMLWRGQNSKTQFMMVDASTLVRRSRDSNNLYQLLMENSPSLQDLPKRSRSLICSTSYAEVDDKYSGGGTIYAVFPGRGQQFVVSSSDDFVQHRIKTGIFSGRVVCTLSSLLSDFIVDLEVATKTEVSRPYTDIDELNKLVGLAIKELGASAVLDIWYRHLRISIDVATALIQKHPSDFFSELAKSLTPASLSLKVLEVGEGFYDQLAKFRDNECWFSGQCLMISADLLAKLIPLLDKNGHSVAENVRDDLGVYGYDDYDYKE